MCTGMEVLALSSLISAGTRVAALAGQKKPKQLQAAKSPDAGVTDDERRNKLLAQLAAGAGRTNPSGGKATSFSTGSVSLGE